MTTIINNYDFTAYTEFIADYDKLFQLDKVNIIGKIQMLINDIDLDMFNLDEILETFNGKRNGDFLIIPPQHSIQIKKSTSLDVFYYLEKEGVQLPIPNESLEFDLELELTKIGEMHQKIKVSHRLSVDDAYKELQYYADLFGIVLE